MPSFARHVRCPFRPQDKEDLMTKRLVLVKTEHVVGWIGLVLLLLVAKLADRAYGQPVTRADRVTAWMARRGIDAVGVLGWLADRLPGPAAVTSPAPPATQTSRVHA
jgi:hypothetical protein